MPHQKRSDWSRLLTDALLLNVRKDRWIRSAGRTRCPCQHPSDSGRAGETQCEAVISWRTPERFRFLCPNLQRYGREWRCGVDRAAIRPYWARALLIWFVLLLIAWVPAATALWLATSRPPLTLSSWLHHLIPWF